MQITGQVMTFVNHDYQARNGMEAQKVDVIMIMDMSIPPGDRMISLLAYTLTEEESKAHNKGVSLVDKTVTIAFRNVGVNKAGTPTFRGRIVATK